MKSKLSFLTCMMPGAEIGVENPLPDIQKAPGPGSGSRFDKSVPEDVVKYSEYGRISSILPYRMQDGYDREKKMREYKAAVLENDCLYAVFFPQFGGKLWTLYDKKSEKHLLQTNPVFQPCNLALRNAWTSGGVEWNIGMTGHTPFTLSPLHTAVYEMSDGTPVLRMYEWERIRKVMYQIDAYLPNDSRFLMVRVRICNANDEETPMYWWSNAAVYETPDTRLIVPAEKAILYDYGDGFIKNAEFPLRNGIDNSYSTRIEHSMDMFYNIPDGCRKWEAALDGGGEGLIQTSTDLLMGRKLFVWGNSPGGKRWQKYLSCRGQAYIEMQAGLARTQMQRVPMPPGAVWEWVEAYGYIKADPEKAHSENWREAYTHVGEMLEKALPRKKMDAELERLRPEMNRACEPCIYGSGWGALELRRANEGECFGAEAAVFSAESMGDDQKPWLTLLEMGEFPYIDPEDTPAAYVTQREWKDLLSAAIKSGKSDHWHAWLQLGVMYCAEYDFEKAAEAFETSCTRTLNGWAKRNLAAIKSLEGEDGQAADLLLEAASRLRNGYIAIECGKALLKAERYMECADFCDSLPETTRSSGRIRIIRAQSAAALDDYETAIAVLNSETHFSDIREGEVSLSDLWIKLQKRKMAKKKQSRRIISAARKF